MLKSWKWFHGKKIFSNLISNHKRGSQILDPEKILNDYNNFQKQVPKLEVLSKDAKIRDVNISEKLQYM